MHVLMILVSLQVLTRMLLGNFVKMNNVMPGAVSRVRQTTGVPGAGTTEVQTFTRATVDAGQCELEMDGIRSAPILFGDGAAQMQTKLRAMPNIGASGVTVTGTGPWTFTFGGNLDKKLLSTLVVRNNTYTNGGTPVVPTITKTTPGVNATGRGMSKGTVLVNDATGVMYTNTGTPSVPVWTAS